jgi:hypothetical protein
MQTSSRQTQLEQFIIKSTQTTSQLRVVPTLSLPTQIEATRLDLVRSMDPSKQCQPPADILIYHLRALSCKNLLHCSSAVQACLYYAYTLPAQLIQHHFARLQYAHKCIFISYARMVVISPCWLSSLKLSSKFKLLYCYCFAKPTCPTAIWFF